MAIPLNSDACMAFWGQTLMQRWHPWHFQSQRGRPKENRMAFAGQERIHFPHLIQPVSAT
jgi:hypothetical protein